MDFHVIAVAGTMQLPLILAGIDRRGLIIGTFIVSSPATHDVAESLAVDKDTSASLTEKDFRFSDQARCQNFGTDRTIELALLIEKRDAIRRFVTRGEELEGMAIIADQIRAAIDRRHGCSTIRTIHGAFVSMEDHNEKMQQMEGLARVVA